MNIRRFPLGALWTNGYLFWDSGKTAFFVDPGGDPEDVLQFIEAEQLQLKNILLTHGHMDHIFGVEALRNATGASVLIHQDDAPMLESAEANLSKFMGEPCATKAAEKVLVDGDCFSVGEMNIRLIHTPGHTRGSSLFYVEHQGETVLISGDTLFAQSVGRTDLPGGSGEALEHSLLRFRGFEDSLRVLPGHGPETTIGEEKQHNPYWPR